MTGCRKGVGFKARLAAKELTIGSWLSFGFPPVAELMASAGFEFLVVDQEHAAIGVAEMHGLVQIIDLAGVVPLVRVPANDAVYIKQALDAGAHGVLVPMVNSAQEAAEAVARATYPPRGVRGAGLARAQDYGLGFARYREWAERETVVIVQVEHVDGVGQLEAILAVDGVDGFIIGPYDLSASLGHPGEWRHPDVRATLDEVARVVRGSTKPAGFHVVHSDRLELSERIACGYRFLAYGDDMVFLAEKAQDEFAAARAVMEQGK
jgi:2-dehydro-3-deoxyglucarate aldolase